MFGLSWGELMVVGIVALIIIGPKDLPVMFRTIGEFTGKARAMAREFTRAMNDAAKDSGVNDISKGLKAATNPTKFGVDKLKEASGVAAATAALSPERAAAREKMDKAAEAMREREAERSAKAAEEARKPVAADPKPDTDTDA